MRPKLREGDWRPAAAPGRLTGKFQSGKAIGRLWWESQNERDFLCLAEFDSGVLCLRRYLPKESIRYRVGSQWHRYKADFWVKRKDVGWQVVEVKSRKQARTEEYIVLFRAVRPIFRKKGFSYKVALDTQILRQPRLANAKCLLRYGRTLVSVNDQIACIDFVRRADRLPLGEVVEAMKARSIAPRRVYALLRHGILDVDLDQPLTKASPVWLAGDFDPALAGSE